MSDDDLVIELEMLEPGENAPFAGIDGGFEWSARRFNYHANRRVAVVGVLALLVAPFFLPVLEGRLITRLVAIGVVLIGLQFVVGIAGQLSLCHGVFVGMGSYAMAIAVGRWGWPHLVGLVFACVVGYLSGCLVGALAVRIKATYLGPVTLAVAVAFPAIVKRFSWLTGGASGLPLVRNLGAPSWLHINPARPELWNHIVVVLVAVLAFVVTRNVSRSPIGLAARAVAQNPLSAAASGIEVWRMRVASFGWGAMFGALGGALLVLDVPIVGADSYDLFRSLGYYAALVVGGVGSMAGAVVGAILLVAVPWSLDNARLAVSPNFVFGVLLVGATLLAPDGVAAAVRKLQRRFVDAPPSDETELAAGHDAEPG